MTTERRPINYLSVCSGIEAASEAWKDLPFKPVGFAEIEPFPCAVLAHRHPTVPNFGDMTKHEEWRIQNDEPVDLLVGGTPCQSFSVAGLRRGLADPRGNLALTFLAMVQRRQPRWVLWENVPGVLSSWSDASTDTAGSSGEGRGVADEIKRALELLADAEPDHAARARDLVGDEDLEEAEQSSDLDCLLAGLAELGYGWAYRVLDAQHFGVAQRRCRIFVVAHLGDWQPAAAVLLEPESMRGDPAPSREAGGGDPRVATGGAGTRHAPDVAGTFDRGTPGRGGNKGYQDHLIAQAFPWQSGLDPVGKPDDLSPTLVKNQTVAVAIQTTEPDQNGSHLSEEQSPTLRRASQPPAVAVLPREKEITHGAPVDTTGHQGDHVVGEGDVFPCLPARGGNNGGGPGVLVHTKKGDPAFFSITPANSGKGYSAREVQVAQPIMATGTPSHGNQGGDLVVEKNPPLAFKPSHFTRGKDGAPDGVVPALSADADKGDQDPLVFTAGNLKRGEGPHPSTVAHTLKADAGDQEPLVCVDMGGGKGQARVSEDQAPTLNTSAAGHVIAGGDVGHVRRLTPVECERLQGFPDNHTLIPGDWRPRVGADRDETIAYLIEQHGLCLADAELLADCPDSPRYKACGNSMCTLVMRWLGLRIDAVDMILFRLANKEAAK